MSVELIYGLSALPEPVRELFRRADARSIYTELDWFRLLAANTGISDERCIVAVHREGSAVDAALVLERRRRALHAPPTREIGSLANFYSCLYRPVVAAGRGIAVVRTLVGGAARAIAATDLFDLQALPDDPALLAAIEGGFRDAGLWTARYEGFGNWFESVGTDDYKSYLARRPPMLRNLLRRKQRQADRAAVRFDLSGGDGDVERAIAAYEAVYRTSWKIEEPHAGFMPALIRLAAARGSLRIGVAYLGERPIAGQVWLVEQKCATIYKLAHDEALPKISPGSLLTAAMMRHVIEFDRVAEVDFGWGDDPYKQLWLAQRRVRWGILAAKPTTMRGLAAGLRHVVMPRALAPLRRFFGRR